MSNDKKDMKPKYQGYDAMGAKIEEERKRQVEKREAAAKNAEGRPTNAFFATHDEAFMAACEKAGVPNTPRQASKFMRKRGRAYTDGC